MAVLVALNRKRVNLKGQITKLISTITDEETMDIPQLDAQLEILKKIQDKFEVLKEDNYKSASDEEYLTIEASLSEIDQEIQHLEPRVSFFKTFLWTTSYPAHPISTNLKHSKLDFPSSYKREACTCTSGAVVGFQLANPKHSQWIGTQKR
ncbi:hypothetical protein NPIL_608961 [Nephila pilipes]|uniref:Uncharacterized protein n=1 Tax=Nephila pilipes TaxID=299642 RepID=A0A8X6TMP7_NEPPI|nr:hypothetical protein NPIL_608961 [Nephila pilipes]